MTPKVIILSGIPGCGKSTWAKHYLLTNGWKTTIISRDGIRETHFPVPYIYTKQSEDMVTSIFNDRFTCALENGFDIVIDNTNCKEFWINGLLKFISQNSYGYNVYIKFFDVHLWCAAWRAYWREKKTGKVVPYSVIKAMHKSYKKMNRKQFKAEII
jgi:predicted kinase